MRLIDAEHLKRWILARWEETDPRSEYPLRAIDIIDQVDREDTIDAEPVVRCKDCKYVIPYESGGFNCLTCPNVDRDVDENWFCADGERKTEVKE